MSRKKTESLSPSSGPDSAPRIQHDPFCRTMVAKYFPSSNRRACSLSSQMRKTSFEVSLLGLFLAPRERDETHQAAPVLVARSKRDLEGAGIMRPAKEKRLLFADVVPLRGKCGTLLLAFIPSNGLGRTCNQDAERCHRYDRSHRTPPDRPTTDAVTVRLAHIAVARAHP